MSTAGLRPIGPRPIDELGRAIAAHLTSVASALASPARRVRAGGDSEAIHDLRVATRRASAALGLWSPGLDLDLSRLARRALARLRRRLARTRELEVLTLQLAAMLPGESGEVRGEGLRVVSRLTRRVALRRSRASRLVRRRRMERLALRIAEAAATTGGESALVLAAARRHVDQRASDLRAILGLALVQRSDEVLHEARLVGKRWRYALEGLAAVTADPLRDTLKIARDLQQCLGAIHDAAQLRDELARRARRAEQRELKVRFEALSRLAAKAAEARRRAVERLDAVAAAVLGGA
jgi:CHAD domain-containing protein